MLRVEESARRRFAFLGGVMAVFMGGLAISGILERFSNPTANEVGMNLEDVSHVRENARQFRELRKEASALGRKGHWQEVVRYLDNPSNVNRTTPYLRAEAALRAGQFEDAEKGFLTFMPGDSPVSMGTRFLL